MKQMFRSFFTSLIFRCLNCPILHVQKILNNLTFINVKYLHVTKINCNFVSSKLNELLTQKKHNQKW